MQLLTCSISTKKNFIKQLLYIGFVLTAILNIAEAQVCSGSWALQRPLTSQCVVGQWIAWQNVNNPSGCPASPVYSGVETNTFTFTTPVSSFSIDFIGFDGAPFCPRIEIQVNGIFYPLSASNITDFPPSSTCTNGSFLNIQLTGDGYITLSNFNGPSYANGRGKITINNVNAMSVSVSTNDGFGTTFSNPFNCLPVVPLKLISFKGHSSLCKTQLNWETGIESNIKNIEVQNGDDGVLFYNVGEVSPKGSNSRYSFLTANPTDAYFRLKINDLDGYYEYSNILHIKSDCSKISYQAIPNPTSNSIEIMGLKKDDKVFVVDMLGRKVLTFTSSQSNDKLDIQKLAPGMYILQVSCESTIKANLKIIKN